MRLARFPLFLAVLITLTAPVFGAGQSDVAAAEVVTIKYVHGYPNVPGDVLYFEKVKDILGIEVEAQGVEALHTKLPTMFAAKDLPDLLAVIRPIANEYGPQGALVPVNDYLIQRRTWKSTTQSM